MRMVRARIIVSCLFLTILIFALGILLNYGLDFVRISTIADVMSRHELNTAAYLAEQEFTDSFGGNRCVAMNARIAQLKEEIKTVGADLGSYSAFSFFRKKDYDYLKRKYFLLELKFLTLIEQLNKECNRPYIPIIFFYQIDDDISERQGFILADLSKDYEQQVIVLSIDKDYKDEPLVQLLAAKYNVTSAPTIIIDNQKTEGMFYTGGLNLTIRNLLRRADPFGQEHDFTYVLKAAGRNANEFAKNLSGMLAGNLSAYARADIMLMLGRIMHNDTLICESLPFYDLALKETKNTEKQALIYETIASIDCGRNKKAFLLEAAKRWQQLNNTARARLDESLAMYHKINLKFETGGIEPALSLQNTSRVIIGETSIIVRPGDHVLTQSDRVKRDWLGLQSGQDLFGPQILTTFSERLEYTSSELREDIGWHEGGRMKELAESGIEPVVAYGTLVARLHDKWYASDENGIFRFEVPLDKLQYPTTRFLRDDIAIIMDTHGVNMLVEQAIRQKADAVIGCCDHPGKVKAAEYLSGKGVPVICYPDKYVYLALGHNLSLVGSPPMRREGDKVIIGARPLEISAKETIIVMNATDLPYAIWYYQTPANYFSALKEAVPSLKLEFVQVNSFNQMANVVRKAEMLKSDLIAARVFNSNDYEVLKRWLYQSPKRKAILFHSSSYPYGYLLLSEFPGQTSFDDPNPRFVE
jgi:hypothetical protein